MRTLADFTAKDLAALANEGEIDAYRAHIERWQAELDPNGDLECCFAAEIARAAWRIEHYAPLGPHDPSDESSTNWLRYRDRTNLGIRRNLEELRRLQSDRYLQSHLGIILPGVASLRIVLPGLKLPKQQPEQPSRSGKPEPAEIKRSENILHSKIQDEERRQLAELRQEQAEAKPQPVPVTSNPPSHHPAAPRNAPCPCNSGRKYKHCCGHWSKTTLPMAA